MLAFCRVEVPIFGATGSSFEECQSGCKGGDAFKVVGAEGGLFAPRLPSKFLTKIANGNRAYDRTFEDTSYSLNHL